MPSAIELPSAPLSAAEVHELQELEKLVRFRDSVFEGTHPRFKFPAQMSSKQPASTRTQGPASSADQLSSSASTASSAIPPAQPTRNAVNGNRVDNMISFKSNAQLAAGAEPGSRFASSSAGVPAFNPVLLEKSDELKKAEIQLQRQHIERLLREDLEHRRRKAQLQNSEQMPDFDLSEVLMRALERVKAAALPSLTDANLPANASPESDSFDDNTFYSSQHDTPESNQSARLRQDPEDVPMIEDSPYEPPPPTEPTQSLADKPLYPQGPSSVTRGLNGPTSRTENLVEVLSSHESGGASRSRDSGSNGIDQPADARRQAPSQRVLDPAFEPRGPAVVRAHDLSPVAPQPAHVSPLAVAGDHALGAQGTSIPQGAPAQVMALRNEVALVTSPESSPQNGKGPEKKKKKKKRKADRQAEALASPGIKPEPRSPSPINAPPYSRPFKRQRQAVSRQMQEPTYDDAARCEPTAEPQPQHRYSSRQYREEPYTLGYDAAENAPRRPVPQPTAAPSYERDYFEDRRPGSTHVARPRSPGFYTVQYAPSEGRPGRSVSQAVPYFRDAPDPPRMSVRPEAGGDRSRSPAMGPPRAPPARIVVDQYGREYFEPSRAVRQSVAPLGRSGDPEIIYERTASRTASRRPGPEPDTIEEGGVLYRRVSPAYAPPRRVITQPEYAGSEYRSYSQRDYSAHSAGPADYIPVRTPVERRYEEAPREYVTRAATVRPAEPIRYDVAPEGFTRIQSVRPDMQVREYRPASVHPDARRDGVQPVARDYNSGLGEGRFVRGEYSVRPGEDRYYGRAPPMRGDEEIAFIEQPRGATQEVVYTDDGRREIWRS